MGTFRAKSQRGNVFFLLLLVVVLFAGLVYAVNQSNRGGGKNINAEQEMLDTGVSENCTSLIDNMIERLRVVKGCALDEISYELPSGDNVNPDAPADRHCHLFDPAGAGATPCGEYTEIIIATGTITLGDTTTIALLPGPSYFRCASFGGWNGQACTPQFSIDGTTFIGANKMCWDKDDDARGMGEAAGMADFLCDGACGGTAQAINLASPSPPMTFYQAGSGGMVPYTTGNCETAYGSIECLCW